MTDNNENKQEKKFPVREGSENSSILHDQDQVNNQSFPEPHNKDQKKNQPEFTEEQPNRESPNSPAH